MLLAEKLVCVAIWMGASTSKLDRHFPFVISTMMSNNPLTTRTKSLKRKFFENSPTTCVRAGSRGSSPTSAPRSRCWCVGAAVLPSRLADGDRRLRQVGLPLRHPVGDSDGHTAGVERLHDVRHGHLVRRPRRTRSGQDEYTAAGGAVRRTGAHRGARKPVPPQNLSFLPGMRYYAGDWDTTWWCIEPSANEKIERGLVVIASMPASQLEKVYGSKQAMITCTRDMPSAASTLTARRC